MSLISFPTASSCRTFSARKMHACIPHTRSLTFQTFKVQTFVFQTFRAKTLLQVPLGGQLSRSTYGISATYWALNDTQSTPGKVSNMCGCGLMDLNTETRCRYQASSPTETMSTRMPRFVAYVTTAYVTRLTFTNFPSSSLPPWIVTVCKLQSQTHKMKYRV